MADLTQELVLLGVQFLQSLIGLAQLLEQLGLALGLEGRLQLEVLVEVVLDGRLARPGDEQNPADAASGQLLRVLNDEPTCRQLLADAMAELDATRDRRPH